MHPKTQTCILVEFGDVVSENNYDFGAYNAPLAEAASKAAQSVKALCENKKDDDKCGPDSRIQPRTAGKNRL